MKKFRTLSEAKKAFKKRFLISYKDRPSYFSHSIYKIKGRVYNYTICTYLEWLNEFYK